MFFFLSSVGRLAPLPVLDWLLQLTLLFHLATLVWILLRHPSSRSRFENLLIFSRYDLSLGSV